MSLSHRSLSSVVGIGLAAGALAFPQYRVVDMGRLPGQSNSGAYGLNELGWAVGRSNTGSGQAFLWRDDLGIRQIGPWRTQGQSEATGINNLGQVCGFNLDLNFNRRAFITRPGGFGPFILPTFPGGDASLARDLNDSGVVVGEAYSPAAGAESAFRWSATWGMEDLGSFYGQTGSSALTINNLGWIGGWSSTGVDFVEATLWKPDGTIIDLGKHAGYQNSFATGMNDSGTVVGYSNSIAFSSTAFMWTPGAGFVSLGYGPNGELTEAYDINNSGEVVGFIAKNQYISIAVWTLATGWVDLQGHLEPGSQSYDLGIGRRINSRGEIVGGAKLNGIARAIKLVPIQ